MWASDPRMMAVEGLLRSPLAKERERVTTIFFYAAVLLLGYFVVRIFEPFFVPLAWAAVLAIFVYPWHERAAAQYGTTSAALISTIVVTVVIIGPGLAVLTAFVQESRAALLQVDQEAFAGPLALVEQAWERVRVLIPGARAVDLRTMIQEIASKTGGVLAGLVGSLLADLAVVLFQLFVTLLALFFILRDADSITRYLRRALPFEELRRERMIRQTRELVYVSIAAGLLIASLQGLAGGIVFALLGLGAPVFWGVMMGFLALLPLVGTWVVWLPASIWLMATGHVAKGILLAVLGATIVASIDNFLRPAMLAGRARMNGLLMFISLLGGVSVFGLIGLVLGPVITAIVTGLFEAYAGPAEIVSSHPVEASGGEGRVLP
jgi:predicted PurR-regulated permease PerM